MDSNKSSKQHWAKCLVALSLHAHQVMAEETETKKTRLGREMENFSITPVVGIAVAFIAYLIYASCSQNAGALIVTGNKGKPSKPKKVKKKEYLREDNEEFFK